MAELINRLSRRESLKLAGYAGIAGLIGGSRAFAQAPADPAGQDKVPPNGGFYRLQVGDAEIVIIADGGFQFPAAHPLFGANVTAQEVNQALENQFIPSDKVAAVVHGMVVRSNRDVVLIDTGCGPGFGPGAGKLIKHLQAAGFAPGDITAVVLTHAHRDHMSGLLNAEKKSNFPNAQLLMSKAEYAFWTGSPDLSKSGLPAEAHAGFIQGAQEVLKSVNWELVEGEKEIRPKIRVVPAPGHTPGHLTLLIDGGANNQLYYITDAIHHAAIQMPNPHFHVAFDTDREEAVVTRKKILDRAAADKVLVAGAHLPFPAIGHIKSVDKGYTWHPSYWAWDKP